MFRESHYHIFLIGNPFYNLRKHDESLFFNQFAADVSHFVENFMLTLLNALKEK